MFAPLVLVTGVATQGVPFGGFVAPFLSWSWRLGHLSALTRALGGDGASTCVPNSPEQDNFVEVILILPGGNL